MKNDYIVSITDTDGLRGYSSASYWYRDETRKQFYAEAAAGISLGPRKEFKSEISHSYWRANTATGCVM